jgi:hypothetical protein
MPHDDEQPRPSDKPDKAPETPPDEPAPTPVQDPPAEPGQPPYVVARRARVDELVGTARVRVDYE